MTLLSGMCGHIDVSVANDLLRVGRPAAGGPGHLSACPLPGPVTGAARGPRPSGDIVSTQV
jgi:hypothetical protein